MLQWLLINFVIENKNYVVGANKVDYHLKNVQYGRDFKKTTVSIEIGSDLALVKDGDLCLHCNSKLKIEKGIEIGHVFKLGTAYSEKLNAYFVGADGVRQPIIMGCYGIGVGRKFYLLVLNKIMILMELYFRN
ncbi:MAG: hypothetical protein CM1200mP37_2260 [Chloroflexota bacterium]|nr:MAG: hypothetical protein CM1200mP37_2260 [Chloroflexota bacterium]